MLLCALDFLFEHVSVSVGVTLRQISAYLYQNHVLDIQMRILHRHCVRKPLVILNHHIEVLFVLKDKDLPTAAFPHTGDVEVGAFGVFLRHG